MSPVASDFFAASRRMFAALLTTLSLFFPSVGFGAEVPRIEISAVPLFGQSGRVLGRIQGVVVGEHLVVVAGHLEGKGWLPRFASIGADGNWEADFPEKGAEARATLFRAWLVPAKSDPLFPAGSECVPGKLARDAVAQHEVRRPDPQQKFLSFSGRRWRVKSCDIRVGPGGNYFGREQAWVDDEGRLHLRISHDGERWQSAEIVSEDSFGEGRYEWEILSPLKMNERVVLGFFTWQDECPHHEIDVEISRWGRSTNRNNHQFVVQPHSDPRNISRSYFSETSASTRHIFERTIRDVRFEAWDGREQVHTWTFNRNGGVPAVGAENVRINLWLVDGQPPSDGLSVEIVVSAFRFTKRTD